MKPKVLIFNGYYHPSKNCGGPITSIENVVNACSNTFDFYVVCYNHDFNDKTPFNVKLLTWGKIGKANVFYVEHNYMDFSKRRNFKLLSDLKPDLIWFSGVLTPNNKLVTVKNAKKLGIPVLFSPRGELSADRVSIKWYKKKPYLMWLKMTNRYKNCYFHGTSEDEIDGIVKFFGPDNNHVFKCPNISILPQDNKVVLNKKPNHLNVFFFSRIHPVKNVLFAIEILKECKNKVVFDIYGPIEDDAYWGKCLSIIKSLPSNVKVNYGGLLTIENKNLVIQSHDCFLFPTVNENYGHVIAEVLANSRPVIISKGTTPWDDLDGKAGFAIPLESPTDFSKKIDYLASLSNEDFIPLLDSTREYFLVKSRENDAIAKHKMMLKKIIEDKGCHINKH